MIFDERIEDLEFAAKKSAEILECAINISIGEMEGMSPGEVYDAYPEKFNRIVERRKSYEQHV